MLTILIGANLYCLNQIFKLEDIQWAMVLLYVCTTLCLGIASVFVCISLWAKKVSDLPLASELNNYYGTLLNHYNGKEEAEKLVEESFSNYLVGIYVSCTDVNTKVNDSKLKMTVFANVTMIISLVFLLLTFAVVFPSASKEEEIHKVEIIEGGDIDDK